MNSSSRSSEQSNIRSDNANPNYSFNNYCTFNPLEKYVETVEKNEKLYEALLKSEREKIALLEKILGEKNKK